MPDQQELFAPSLDLATIEGRARADALRIRSLARLRDRSYRALSHDQEIIAHLHLEFLRRLLGDKRTDKHTIT